MDLNTFKHLHLDTELNQRSSRNNLIKQLEKIVFLCGKHISNKQN